MTGIHNKRSGIGRRCPFRFKRWPPQIQEVAPTEYGVALCSVWHFALRGMDSRGGPHRFKRWPPPVRCGTLFRVALSSIQDLTRTGGTT